MSEHAHPQKEELKKHGDELENTLKDSGERSGGKDKKQPAKGGRNKE